METGRQGQLELSNSAMAALPSPLGREAALCPYPHNPCKAYGVESGMVPANPRGIPEHLATRLLPCGITDHLGVGTRHRIADILSRPASAGVSGGAGFMPGLPQLNTFAAEAGAGLYYSTEFASLKTQSLGLYRPSTAQHWRASNQPADTMQKSFLTEASSKRKHTRPTFSGRQIFALEKTFEQTKYLAGPERARLAYSLGMTESQVKVWFQNRRTKWRKKATSDSPSPEANLDKGSYENDDDEEYNKPLDPDSDDEKLRLLLRKHRPAFSMLRVGADTLPY